jgi:hypothetical protein
VLLRALLKYGLAGHFIDISMTAIMLDVVGGFSND